MVYESMLACPNCATLKTHIQATPTSISYGEEVEFSNFSYKRLNHFLDWLACFQAKESMSVKKSIIMDVMRVLAEMNVDEAMVDRHMVKGVLRKLKLNKFYNHTP